jgi:putative hydrolase of the HAD superfamily
MSHHLELGRVAGLVIDAVGTLIEATPPVAEIYTQIARRQGLAVSADEVKALFHRHFGEDEVDEMHGPLATDESCERQRWVRIVGNVLPDLPEPERGFQELWDHFGRSDAWRCFADVPSSLRALEVAGMPVRIASNFDGRLRQVVQGLPPLARWSESLIISSEIGYRKPHPSFYKAACASLALPPEQVLCVGDDPENDGHGPRRAGCLSVLIHRGGPPPEDLPHFPGLDALVSRLLP